MDKRKIALSTIGIAIVIGSLSAIHKSLQGRQDLHAKWRIEINKDKSSLNRFSQLSRNFESEHFSKDFPAFFYSSTSNKRERADVSCWFAKETRASIFHECTAKANVDHSLEFDQLEAWIYRISIPGYQRSESRMLVRLAKFDKDQASLATQDQVFVDPINHPEQGNPEIQKILIPARSFSTFLNYKNQRVFNIAEREVARVLGKPDLIVFNLLLLGAGLTALIAITSPNQRSRSACISIALICCALIELTSSIAFQNPLPRNILLEKWRLADALDNILLGFEYQRSTNGLSGKELVRSVWDKAHPAPQKTSPIHMIEGIDPKQDGLLFSQDCESNRAQDIDLLIIGASVAEGWHASRIDNTLWSKLSHYLNKSRKTPLCVGVKARAGIHSNTELEFVADFLRQAKPKGIVLIHAQNDIINPAFNVTSNPMGVSRNFNNILLTSADEFTTYSAEIRSLANKNNVHVFEYIPPSALDKQPLSSDEKSILIGYASHKSHDWTLPSRLLNTTFDRIASKLRLADRINGEYTFVDGRKTFNGEEQTMFADIWHFGDVGHDRFATLVADTVSFWLQHSADKY